MKQLAFFTLLIFYFSGCNTAIAQADPKSKKANSRELDSLTQRNFNNTGYSNAVFTKKVFLPDIQFKTELKFDTIDFNDIVSFYNFDSKANHSTNFTNDLTFDSCMFRKRVNFDFAAFRGEFRVDNSVFDSFANFYKTEYHGAVSLTKVVFKSPVRLVQTSFYSPLYADSVRFNDTADFSSYSAFLTWVAFKHCAFNGKKVDFSFDNFSKDLDFMNNMVAGRMSFENAVLEGTTRIIKDTFRSALDLDYSRIDGQTTIDTCMLSAVNFSNATINARISFNSDRFFLGSKLVFNHAVLKENAYMSFNKTNLPDTLDFSYINNITNEINLSDADMNGNAIHYINLTNSNISKFHLNYRNFKLVFADDTSRSLNARFEEKNLVYQDLLKNFLARGQEDSWAILDVEYQDFVWEWKWGDSHLSWVRIFPHYWNNFGHAKSRVFIWTIVFLLVFSMFTFF